MGLTKEARKTNAKEGVKISESVAALFDTGYRIKIMDSAAYQAAVIRAAEGKVKRNFVMNKPVQPLNAVMLEKYAGITEKLNGLFGGKCEEKSGAELLAKPRGKF